MDIVNFSYLIFYLFKNFKVLHLSARMNTSSGQASKGTLKISNLYAFSFLKTRICTGSVLPKSI